MRWCEISVFLNQKTLKEACCFSCQTIFEDMARSFNGWKAKKQWYGHGFDQDDNDWGEHIICKDNVNIYTILWVIKFINALII